MCPVSTLLTILYPFLFRSPPVACINNSNNHVSFPLQESSCGPVSILLTTMYPFLFRSPPVACINTPGSFVCGPCPAGYRQDFELSARFNVFATVFDLFLFNFYIDNIPLKEKKKTMLSGESRSAF